ncbi:energy transducer TonB [Hellea sp.]|nr:energy transducer TonB [Hellea sp.]
MYQSIDDPQDDLDALERSDKHVYIWGLAILCAVLIAAIIYLSTLDTEAEPEGVDMVRAEQVTYRKAISEQRAAMRRARLQDFLTTHPESDYQPVVQAQLDVINLEEAAQWRDVNTAVFDAETSREDKLAALDNFEAKWGGALLGGRDDEIRELREDISQIKDVKKIPSRKLPDQKSPIPQSVPDTMLAGGPRPVAPPVIIRPAPPPPLEPVVQLNITQPTIRRNVTPRYPRKAMRREIEALVELKLNIDERGRVAMTELVDVRAERYQKDFVKAAERAAMRTRFNPKLINGRPTAATGIIKRYRFKLGE